MHVALISPTQHDLLNHYGRITHYHMALTHLVLEDDYYARFYRERSAAGDYVILDNSVIELGSSLTTDMLVEAGRKIRASEVILPDVLDDGEATVHQAMAGISALARKQGGGFKLMAVAQGKTIGEFLQCYRELASNRFIDVVGIPKRASRLMPGTGRYPLLQHMLINKIIRQDKSHHLLGVWENPIEIKYLSMYNWIRGVDSVIPFWAASQGLRFDVVAGLEGRDNRTLQLHEETKMDLDALNHNILCMLRWANDSTTRI